MHAQCETEGSDKIESIKRGAWKTRRLKAAKRKTSKIRQSKDMHFFARRDKRNKKEGLYPHLPRNRKVVHQTASVHNAHLRIPLPSYLPLGSFLWTWFCIFSVLLDVFHQLLTMAIASVTRCFADWRAICPAHTQAAGSKKNSSFCACAARHWLISGGSGHLPCCTLWKSASVFNSSLCTMLFHCWFQYPTFMKRLLHSSPSKTLIWVSMNFFSS